MDSINPKKSLAQKLLSLSEKLNKFGFTKETDQTLE
jgi:hypothetical protein